MNKILKGQNYAVCYKPLIYAEGIIVCILFHTVTLQSSLLSIESIWSMKQLLYVFTPSKIFINFLLYQQSVLF